MGVGLGVPGVGEACTRPCTTHQTSTDQQRDIPGGNVSGLHTHLLTKATEEIPCLASLGREEWPRASPLYFSNRKYFQNIIPPKH